MMRLIVIRITRAIISMRLIVLREMVRSVEIKVGRLIVLVIVMGIYG